MFIAWFIIFSRFYCKEPVSEVVTREEITKEKTMEKGCEENKGTTQLYDMFYKIN